jgi:hypothetical protein
MSSGFPTRNDVDRSREPQNASLSRQPSKALTDPWSIVDWKLKGVSEPMRSTCPMSLSFVQCNIANCPFDFHLCPTYANGGKCTSNNKGDRACSKENSGWVHMKPTCHRQVRWSPNKSSKGGIQSFMGTFFVLTQSDSKFFSSLENLAICLANFW